MINLERKYRENRINSQELIELRDSVNSMSDSSLSAMLEDSWESDNSENVIPSNSCFDNIMGQIDIDSEITAESKFKHYIDILRGNIFRVAAAVLIIFLGYSTLHYRKEAAVVSAQHTIISTGDGERVSVSLPDGTTVTLNSNSLLTFIPSTFGKGSRSVEFEGEGYFVVEKDVKNPFVICSQEIDVKVLGTTFNLKSRSELEDVELDLTEGKVLFIGKSNQYNLESNHKIIYNKSSGEGVVSQLASNYKTEWKEKQIEFRSADLRMVLQVLNDNFDVDIRVTGEIATINDLFSGTISNTNLEESISIIESVYHLESAKAGKTIVLRSRVN